MNTFTRGLDPKVAMGTGIQSVLDEIDGVIINGEGPIERWRTTDKWSAIGLDEEKEEVLEKVNFRKKNVIIGICNGKYEILKNKLKYDGPDKGDECDLIKVLYDLLDAFRKYGTDYFFMPFAQVVSARTIGMDLVSVQPLDYHPMAAPHYKFTLFRLRI